MHEILIVGYLLSPLLVGLALHGVCIKFGWLRSLARPIDAGATLRGKPLFGANKTYRGLVAVALGTGAGFALEAAVGNPGELQNYHSLGITSVGLAMGAAAMLSELPNSLLKRQFGIAPGKAGGGIAGAVFYVLDQIDMLVGIWIVLGFVVTVTAVRVLWSVVFLFVAHQVFTVVGFSLGMRATAR
jgi:CDP-diglyceride synthetase